MISSLLTQHLRTLRRGFIGLVIVGAVSATSASNVTNGTVVYNGSPGISVTGSSTASFNFDINNDGTNDFFIQTIFGQGAFAPSPAFLTSFVSNGQNVGVASNGLAFGDTVGPASVFLGKGGGTANAAAPIKTSSSYYGFSFINGTTTVYGWMQFGLSTPTKLTLLAWAYETSGAPITVGSTSSASAVPEVSTSTLLMGSAALLAGSIAAWRRRKARVQTAA